MNYAKKKKPDRPCPNPLFLQWLTEWRDESAKTGSNRQFTYAKAINSLKKYPVPLTSGKEAKILEGFGDKICKMLDKKLLDNGIIPGSPILGKPISRVMPSTTVDLCDKPSIAGSSDTSQTVGKTNPISQTSQQRKTRVVAGQSKAKREYIPAYRSGPYALVLALYRDLKKENSLGYMTKGELVREAQTLCEKSFSVPDPGARYTAWSSMGTLIKKGLIVKESNPAKYSLSDSGCELANKLESSLPTDTASGTRPTSFTVTSQPSTSTGITLRLSSDEEDPDQNDNIDSLTVSTASNSLKSLRTDSTMPISSHTNPSQSNSAYTYSQSSVDSISNIDDSSQGSISTSSSVDARPQFVLQQGTYDVILCVDNCETAGGSSGSRKANLLPELKKNGIDCDVRKLQVGDFLWIAKERIRHMPGCLEIPIAKEIVLDYIVERKRMDDLASSITDGRFKEQKFRLKNCGLRKPIYLVEDFGSGQHLSVPETTLQQAVVNTQVIDGFYVKRTGELKQSVAYLTVMTRYLQSEYARKTLTAYSKDYLDSLDSRPDVHCSQQMMMSFSEFDQMTIKNKAMTVTEMFAKQLMQISGLSAEKAKSILEKYRTPQGLLAAYGGIPENSGKEKLLANLKYGKSQRNLGPSVSRMVYQLYNTTGPLQ
ncbi:structure-specific endonuclease subunit MUS81-like [Saccoglossus kowalevskii]